MPSSPPSSSSIRSTFDLTMDCDNKLVIDTFRYHLDGIRNRALKTMNLRRRSFWKILSICSHQENLECLMRSPSARRELVLLVDSISTENDSFLVTNAIVLAVLMLQTTGDSSKEVLGEISVDTFAKLTDIAMLSLCSDMGTKDSPRSKACDSHMKNNMPYSGGSSSSTAMSRKRRRRSTPASTTCSGQQKYECEAGTDVVSETSSIAPLDNSKDEERLRSTTTTSATCSTWNGMPGEDEIFCKLRDACPIITELSFFFV